MAVVDVGSVMLKLDNTTELLQDCGSGSLDVKHVEDLDAAVRGHALVVDAMDAHPNLQAIRLQNPLLLPDVERCRN